MTETSTGEIISTGEPSPTQKHQEIIDGALDERNVGLSITEVLILALLIVEIAQLGVLMKRQSSGQTS